MLEPSSSDQYPVGLSYDFSSHVSQQQHSQPNFMESSCSKVRLFCSSCCQEFANTSELNQHMERHNAEVLLENYAASGPALDHVAPLQHESQLTDGDANPMAWSNLMCAGYEGETSCGVASSDQTGNTPGAQDLLPSVCENSDLQQSLTTIDYSNCTVMASGSCSDKANGDGSLATSHVLPAKMSSILAAPTNNSTKKTDEPAETCSQCSITFASGVDLKKHMDLAHRGRQATAGYQCLICAQELPDKASHGAHMEAHAREKPFVCDECGMRLTNQAGLNRHIRRIHEKKHPYECADCKKRFYERHDLQRHVQRRHKDDQESGQDEGEGAREHAGVKKKKGKKKDTKNAGAFPCEICSVRLDTKLAWGCHMWKHTKNSKYIQIEENPGESIAPEVVPASSKVRPKVSGGTLEAADQKNERSPGAKDSIVLNPPKAHLMSYASSSQQPLCLQKPQFLSTEIEPAPAPLNMASNTNAALVT